MGISEMNITRVKLTRKAHKGLPEGSFLMSNVFRDVGVPSFFEKVSPLSERAAQWQRIEASGVDGRLCMVSPYKTVLRDFLKQMFKSQ